MILRFFSLLVLLLAAAAVLYLMFVDVPVTQTEISKEVTVNSTMDQGESTQ